MDNEKVCLPVEIVPSKLSLNDYDIRYDKNLDKIVEIRNK